MTERFDFNEALKAIQSGQAMSGKDGVLAPLVKQLTEAALEAEIDSHIADDVVPNRKNGKSSKTIKTSSGKIDLNTPRDRAGTFEPQFIKKHQTSVSDEIESKILSMFGRGLSYETRGSGLTIYKILVLISYRKSILSLTEHGSATCKL